MDILKRRSLVTGCYLVPGLIPLEDIHQSSLTKRTFRVTPLSCDLPYFPMDILGWSDSSKASDCPTIQEIEILSELTDE